MGTEDFTQEALQNFDSAKYNRYAGMCNAMYEMMAHGDISVDNLNETHRQIIRTTMSMTPLLRDQPVDGDRTYELVGVANLVEGEEWAFGSKDGELSVYGLDDPDAIQDGVVYHFWTKNGRHDFNTIEEMRDFIKAYH